MININMHINYNNYTANKININNSKHKIIWTNIKIKWKTKENHIHNIKHHKIVAIITLTIIAVKERTITISMIIIIV